MKGKLRAIQYVRERQIPFLGICYGMQLACVEFARNVCGLPDAMTSEVDETNVDPVIDFMPDQRNLEMYGGTMRLGTYGCRLEEGSQAAYAYGELEISERHRHRYEFNNRYRPIFEEHGMRFTGHHAIGKTRLVEVVELPLEMHPWFVATQAHPEFKSRPNRPAPLYRAFIGAALGHEERIDGRTGVAEAGILDPSLVTAVVLTHDEERNLPRALTSLPRGIAVLVLDACSRDHTVGVRARRGRAR